MGFGPTRLKRYSIVTKNFGHHSFGSLQYNSGSKFEFIMCSKGQNVGTFNHAMLNTPKSSVVNQIMQQERASILIDFMRPRLPR